MVRVQKLNKYLPCANGYCHVLKNIDLQVPAGDFVAIHGGQSSGKSTLLDVLGGLIHYDSGEYYLLDSPVGQTGPACSNSDILFCRKNIGLVLPHSELNNFASVFHNLIIGNAIIMPYRETRRQAIRILREIGCHHLIRKGMHQLSDEERQKISIARSIIGRPRLLLADDPTAGLDQAAALSILALLHEINQRGTTVVITTSDQRVMAHGRSRYVLTNGSLGLFH